MVVEVLRRCLVELPDGRYAEEGDFSDEEKSKFDEEWVEEDSRNGDNLLISVEFRPASEERAKIWAEWKAIMRHNYKGQMEDYLALRKRLEASR